MFQPPYQHTFKTEALDRLRTAGYPSRRGALNAVSRAMGVPRASLRRWAAAASGDDSSSIAPRAGVGPTSPPDPLSMARTSGFAALMERGNPTKELPEAIRAELLATLRSMDAARSEASYKELVAGFGLLIDKLRLLELPDDQAALMAGDARERLARLIGGEL